MIRSIKLRRFKCFEDQHIKIPSDGIKILAGPNNSGKSTLLHSLAVWNFALLALREEKGDSAIIQPSKHGFGISFYNFNAINLPNFTHMWYNNKSRYTNEDQYTLSIGVDWKYHDGNIYNLTVHFSLKEDKIFVRVENDTVDNCDILPSIVYLPPIAGVISDEEFAPPAIRNRMLGRGLAGSVLRNALLNLKRRSEENLNKEKGNSKRLSRGKYAKFKENDPWEKLQNSLLNRFGIQIEMDNYNETYHASIQAYLRSYKREKSGTYKKFGSKRDLMIEGTGVLQWICVLAYAVDSQTDILLLDEPDAHLHGSLQSKIVKELEHLTKKSRKQILISTHSTKILRRASPNNVISMAGAAATHVANDKDLIKLISNLGENIDRGYIIQEISSRRNVLFLEGDSDETMIRIIAEKLEISISDFAIILSTESHDDRRSMINILRRYYSDIRAISLRDRDKKSVEDICKRTLRDNSAKRDTEIFVSRTLRRQEIENYALVPECIARTIDVSAKDLENWWKKQEKLPSMEDLQKDSGDVVAMDVKNTLIGKLKKHGKGLSDVWKNMTEDELHDDLMIIFNQIRKFSSS